MTEPTVDSSPQFMIRETDEPDRVHLAVSGELDLATVPVLEQRLEHLAAENRPVRLDLSAVEYIDSTGVRLLIQVLTGQSSEDPAGASSEAAAGGSSGAAAGSSEAPAVSSEAPAGSSEAPAVELDASFSPHVRRVLELVGVDRLLAGT